MNELDPRRQTLWDLQDFSHGHGLEIGPLHDAILSKDQADVRYIDIQDRDGLRDYYRDHPGIPVDAIPEIDYPLTQPDGRIVSLAEASRAGAPFDWVVASHVVEHVPDLVGWLADLAEVVGDDGSLILVVPDRRYCFDVHRPPTSVGEMLETHLQGAVRPSVRAVYDHYSRAVNYDTVGLWQGRIPDSSARIHGRAETLDWVERGLSDYVDCHVWLFSPDSFVEQLHELRMIDRSEWYVDLLRPTRTHEIEFMVRLRRVPRGTPRGEPIDGELLPAETAPDWLAHPGVVAERDAELVKLRQRVTLLEAKIARRQSRTERLRGRISRQAEEIARLRSEIGERAEKSNWRSLASRARRVNRPPA